MVNWDSKMLVLELCDTYSDGHTYSAVIMTPKFKLPLSLIVFNSILHLITLEITEQ